MPITDCRFFKKTDPQITLLRDLILDTHQILDRSNLPLIRRAMFQLLLKMILQHLEDEIKLPNGINETDYHVCFDRVADTIQSFKI